MMNWRHEMINPNKEYKAKELATILEIEPEGVPLREVKIKTDSGEIYSGSLDRVHSQPNSLKVGQRVQFLVQYSILLEEYRLSTLIKKRSPK
jgi:hypothetical protein